MTLVWFAFALALSPLPTPPGSLPPPPAALMEELGLSPPGGATEPAPLEASAPATNPAAIVGDPAGPPLTGAALDAAVMAVAVQLRCPVCQGLSIADSPAESAVAMKEEVARMVAEGFSTEQCLLYFEASYGEFVRLDPKPEGLNLLVWAGPAALIAVGLGMVAWMRFGNRRVQSPEPERVDPELVPFVEQVYAAVGRGPS